MSVSAGSTFGVVKFLNLHKLALLVSCNYHLGNTFASFNCEVFIG